MRRRRRNRDNGSVGVAMSPLIDCVFLLLIFFLVTSMLKRFERQIPLEMADPTATLAAEPAGEALLVGVDQSGAVYRQRGRDNFGVPSFVPAGVPLPELLREQAPERQAGRPVELVIEPGTPVQTVIDVIDVFEINGVDRVSARIRSRPFPRGGGGGEGNGGSS